MAAELQLGVDELLARAQLELFEPPDLGPRERLVREVGERRAAHERECLPQQRRTFLGRRAARPADEPFEAGDVDLFGRQRQPVPRRLRRDRVPAERLAELRDVVLERVDRAAGSIFAPDEVDEDVLRHRPAGAQCEHCEQRSRLPPVWRQDPLAVGNFRARSLTSRSEGPSQRAHVRRPSITLPSTMLAVRVAVALTSCLLTLLLAGAAGGGRTATAAFNGKIAFSSARDGNYEIYSMNPDASDQGRLTTAPQTDIDPDWSPDGKQIAFTSNRDGNDEIYVMNADGSGQRRLTTDPATDKNPTWSPGGRDLAFLSERDGNAEIYVMNADERPAPADRERGPRRHPSWSPDGSRIAFATNRDGNYEIYSMAVDGTSQTRLTTSPGEDVSPEWSPDGRAIAFASNRDGNYELYVMNPDGTGQARLTRNLDTDLDPAWSPNGALIAFTTNRDGNNEIYRMDADGGAPTRLTTNAAEDTTPGWQPLEEPPQPVDAVRQARFRGAWAESVYRGALEVSGRVSRPAVLTLALRQGRRVWVTATMPLPAGAFRRSVAVPRTLLPGRYLLDIGVVGSPPRSPRSKRGSS